MMATGGLRVQEEGGRNTNRAMRYRKASDGELRRRLTAEQYAVTQHGATERPYANAYDREFRPGIYVDVTTGQPLFTSADKFDSGCGWPAFSRPISPELLTERADNSHGMSRVGGAQRNRRCPSGPRISRRPALAGWIAILHQQRFPALHSRI